MNTKEQYEMMWDTYWGDVQRYGPLHRLHRRIMLRMIRGLDFSTVLEVGCGNGLNLLALTKKRPRLLVAGCDISEQALCQCRGLLPGIETYALDISQARLPGRYDLVVAFDVLEHIQDDMAALRNMAAMTHRYLLVATLQGRMRAFEKDIGHVRNYQRGELQKKIERADLEVVETVEWGWPLYSPLYRDYLDRCGGQEHTRGNYGMMKKALCHILYAVFLANRTHHGDMLFVLARRKEK